MNRDLENELAEHPEFRAVVARLRAGCECQSAGVVGGRKRPTAVWLTWNPRPLAAASLILLLGLAACLLTSRTFRTARVARTFHARAPREYTLSTSEMIASQNPDGSWQSDFLTRRNAAALRACGDPAAQIAYKKAMRNLRTRGIL